MNKSTAVLAALIATSCAIHAQSSVTIYGAIDTGITTINNSGGGHWVGLQSGINNPDPWGFKGSEDLGGGVYAIFRLEGYFDLSTGALHGGGLFAHNAYMGFESKQYGTLTAGNQYDFMFLSMAVRRWSPNLTYVSPVSGQGGPFQKLGLPQPFGMFDFDRTVGSIRVGNSVMYQSPSINGFTAGAMYGFGEATKFGLNDTKSFGLDYVDGDLAIDSAYTYQKFASIDGGNKGLRNWGLGGHYRIGEDWVDVLYTNTENTGNGGKINVYALGATFPFGSAWNLHTQYQYMKGNAVLTNNSANQLDANLDYSFSKRTGVYVSAFYQHAKGEKADAYLVGMPAPSTTPTETMFRIGFRMKY